MLAELQPLVVAIENASGRMASMLVEGRNWHTIELNSDKDRSTHFRDIFLPLAMSSPYGPAAVDKYVLYTQEQFKFALASKLIGPNSPFNPYKVNVENLFKQKTIEKNVAIQIQKFEQMEEYITKVQQPTPIQSTALPKAKP